jgi:holo-[acyl-carrier protein] synthase
MMGIDIEKIKRFKLKKGNKFLTNTFTEKELSYAFSKNHPEISLCGFFCAKEALRKITKEPLLLNKIEITHGSEGMPMLRKLGSKEKFNVSISHSGDYAVAIVENTKNGRK